MFGNFGFGFWRLVLEFGFWDFEFGVLGMGFGVQSLRFLILDFEIWGLFFVLRFRVCCFGVCSSELGILNFGV